MTKLHHSPLFDHIREYFEQSNPKETLFIFVPYIRTKVLEKLLDDIPNKIVIVTTWKPRDIQLGSSEISLYPFCRDHKISLYVSSTLHLKIYSIGLSQGILATGNISHRGLLSDGNYEASTLIDEFTSQDRLFFEQIRKEARLVDDTLYQELKEWQENNEIENLADTKLEDIVSSLKSDDFSVASLPMTRSVDELVAGYNRIEKGEEPSDDSETTACIIHDLTNYGILSGLSEAEFLEVLSTKFFEHPFIQKIDEFIAPEAYFGRIKEWIQNNCTDVPVPSRRELTGNVQVLLEWFERLGDGRYEIDVPGARSQRIRRLNI